MSIYNPLQYNNQSFSSRVLDTFKEQEAKKQESIDKMNETLRTEAAQGRLGSMANTILEDALAQASESGLIGVNQYEVMNKAMPQFYAAKSAVTELNNAYNAELETAKADSRVRVNGDYMKYLNDKYYGDGEMELADLSSHAANAVNKGFSYIENPSLMNTEVVTKELQDRIGTELITEQVDEGNGMFSSLTISGKQEITEKGAATLLQDEAYLALVLKQSGASSLAELGMAEATSVLNDIVQLGGDKTRQEGASQMRDDFRMEVQTKNQMRQINYNFRLNANREDALTNHTQAIRSLIEANAKEGYDMSPSEAARLLKQQIDPKTNKPIYKASELNRASEAIGGTTRKKTAGEFEREQMQADADKVYADNKFNSIEGIIALGGRQYGEVMLTTSKLGDGSVAVSLTRGGQDVGEEIIVEADKDGNPIDSQVKALRDAVITQAYDAAVLKTDSETSAELSPSEPPVTDNPLKGAGATKYDQ